MGNCAVCTALGTGLGPLLRLVRVKVARSPCTTVAGPSRVVARSNCGVTGTLAAAVLLAGVGSGVPLPVLAVATTGPVAGAGKLTVVALAWPAVRVVVVSVSRPVVVL